MKGIKHVFSILLLIGLLSILVFLDQNEARACFEKTCMTVEIADTLDEQIEGLMHRDELSELAGMLFVYPTEEERSFWMKNTEIPLDMIWIGNDLKVLAIDHAKPCHEEPCLRYTHNAQYILEVNLGVAQKYGVKVGDYVTLNDL